MSTVSDVICGAFDKPLTVILEQKFTIPRQLDHCLWNMQGGCTDGTHGYFIMNTAGGAAKARSRIFKVRLDNWTLVGVSEDLAMYHANDMAYDSVHQRLIVSHCHIHPEEISVVDPITLQQKEVMAIPQKHFSLAYCSEKNLYVAGKSLTYDLVVLDETFNPVRVLPGVEGYVKQGLECDDTFIYFFQTGKESNWIFVFDWDGLLVRKIELPMVGESENLFIWNNKLICAFTDFENGVGAVYEVTLSV